MSSCPLDCCWIDDRIYSDHDVNKDPGNDALVGDENVRPKSFLDNLLDSIVPVTVSKNINDNNIMKIGNLDSICTETTTTTSLDSSPLSTFSRKTIDRTKTPPSLTRFINNIEYNVNNRSILKCDTPSYSVTKTTSTSPRELSIDLSHIGIPISIEFVHFKPQQKDVQQLQFTCASPVGGYFDGRHSMQYNVQLPQLPISTSQDQQPRVDIMDETNLQAPPKLNRCLPKNGFLFLDEKGHSINKPNTNPETGLWCGGSLIDELNEDHHQRTTDTTIRNDDFIDEMQNNVSFMYDYCLAFDNLKISRIFDLANEEEDSGDYYEEEDEEDDEVDEVDEEAGDEKEADDDDEEGDIGDDCLFTPDEEIEEDDEEAGDDDDDDEGDILLIGDDCLFTSDEEIEEDENEADDDDDDDDDDDEEEGDNLHVLIGDDCLFTSDEEIEEDENEVDDDDDDDDDEEEGDNLHVLIEDDCLFTSDEEIEEDEKEVDDDDCLFTIYF